jgi:hypothetical protein
MKGPWNQSYDLDALHTMEEKARYLALAAEHGWWVSFAHDERVLAARVNKNGGRLTLTESIPMREFESRNQPGQ